MATIVAAQSGNWSSTSTWTGGSLPGPGDTAQTGNFVVTIDQNVTATTLEPTGSGRFEVASGGITINANVVMSSTYSGGGVRCTHTTGTVTINGNVTGGGASNTSAVQLAGAGTLTITGNVTGGTNTLSYGVYHGHATATLTVNGTATGGSGNGSYGAFNQTTGTMIVTTAQGGTHPNSFGVYGGSTGGTTKVKQLVFTNQGQTPTSGFIFLDLDAPNNTIKMRTADDSAEVTLVHSSLAVTPDYPAEADVQAGVQYDNAAKTGTLALPAAGDVRDGEGYGAAGTEFTGTLELPAASDVRATVGYGEDGTEFEGTVTLPAAEDVESGVQYGAGGNEYTGSLATGGGPSAADIADAVWNEARAGHVAAGTFGEALDATVSSRAAQTTVDAILEDTGTTLDALIKDIPTNAEFEARTIAADNYFDPATDTVANVTTVGSVTNPVTAGTVSDKTGYALTAAYDAAKTAAQAADIPTGDITAIKAKTDNLPASPAATGDAMTLANNAVSAAVVAADAVTELQSGLSTLTAQQVWEYVTRELTSASGGGATAQEVWEYATRTLTDIDLSGVELDATEIWNHPTRTLTAATVAGPGAEIDGADITLHRGDTFSVTLTGLGDLTERTGLWLTAKLKASYADSEALFQIEETDGLTIINGNAAEDTDGAIVVTDAATGALTVTLAATETAKLPAVKGAVWDVQMAVDEVVTTLAVGELTVTADVTRATG